jgi:hypothetical protein
MKVSRIVLLGTLAAALFMSAGCSTAGAAKGRGVHASGDGGVGSGGTGVSSKTGPGGN